jgi:hypothetical protein
MRTILPSTPGTATRAWVPLILATALVSGHAAAAEDVVGLYVGGAVGQSQVHISSQGFANENFSKIHSAFQLMAGIRPIYFLGAEIEYVDFGHPNSSLNGAAADATLKGAAAFGVVYLPVPLIDLYAKTGLARLQSNLKGESEVHTNCVPCSPSLFRLDRTDSRIVAGAGAQYKYGALAMRAEFDYFSLAGAHPNLVSFGLTWTFS